MNVIAGERTRNASFTFSHSKHFNHTKTKAYDLRVINYKRHHKLPLGRHKCHKHVPYTHTHTHICVILLVRCTLFRRPPQKPFRTSIQTNSKHGDAFQRHKCSMSTHRAHRNDRKKKHNSTKLMLFVRMYVPCISNEINIQFNGVHSTEFLSTLFNKSQNKC